MESWNEPAVHLQSVCSLLPASEIAPAGHVEHCPAPIVSLYLPSSHAVHATPSEAAVYPTTHLQSINSLLPDAELVCVGHVEHTPIPIATLYVPNSHAVQTAPFDVPL